MRVYLIFPILIVLTLVVAQCNKDKVKLLDIKKCEFTRSEIVSCSRTIPFGLIAEKKTVYYYDLTLENDSVVEYNTTTENFVPHKNNKVSVRNNNYSTATLVYEVNLNF